jgi:hypothetical protein
MAKVTPRLKITVEPVCQGCPTISRAVLFKEKSLTIEMKSSKEMCIAMAIRENAHGFKMRF